MVVKMCEQTSDEICCVRGTSLECTLVCLSVLPQSCAVWCLTSRLHSGLYRTVKMTIWSNCLERGI